MKVQGRIFAVIAVSTLALSACALMEPAGNDYSGMQDDEYAAYAAQKNGTAEVFEEFGWSPSRRLTPEEQAALEKRSKLHQLERNLAGEKEREQYYNFRPYLETDDDKIEFLNLPSIEARDRYAMQKGIYFHANKFTPAVKEAISRADIVLGMNKEAVVSAWGEPELVEVAGNQQFGNEKWTYTEFISTPEGFEKEQRVVIFEGGRVVGWQRHD